MTRNLWIALILTLSCVLAQAKIRNFYTLSPTGQLTANEPEFDADVIKMTEAIDKLGLAEINLDIVISPEGDNASFDTGHIIDMPRTMRFANEFDADPVYKTTVDALAVYAHEYGHSIFDNSITQIIPEYGEVRRIKYEMSDLTLKPFKENLTPAQLAETKQKIQQLEQSIKDNKELLRIMGLTMAYHELFADTVAVFVTQSKSAIYEALYNPNIPIWKKNELAYVEARDFAQAHDVDTWTDNSPHNLFGPLRSQIGKDECWPKSPAEAADKLKFLARILTDDMKAKNASKTFAEIIDNKKLIEKYKEVCKK
ncbi:MAG: hypothetical protein ACXVAX_01245 [Pseudobdellovibrio sp.]